MKMPFSIISAAAATMAAMVGAIVDQINGESPARSSSDEYTAIPPLTPQQVEQYAFVGGTDSEIADRFLVSETYLRTEYADVLRVTRALRKLKLRGYESALAQKLNGSMLIWLGRNELGQSIKVSESDEPDPVVD